MDGRRFERKTVKKESKKKRRRKEGKENTNKEIK
jgi:hypothetical protein